MPSVLVTGSNRGLGLEFVRQYATAGWDVHACCREPSAATELKAIATEHPTVRLHRLDVADHGQIERLAQELKDASIDVLINNAGIYGPNKMVLGSIDYSAWAQVLAVNTMAPVKMVECFWPMIERSQRKLIVCISSTMGSIAKNTSEGRHYLYRSSKAALNMVVKTMALDLAPKRITVVSVCPGWVKTDMGGANAALEPPESIRGMRQVIDRLTEADSGLFIYYDGTYIPW